MTGMPAKLVFPVALGEVGQPDVAGQPISPSAPTCPNCLTAVDEDLYCCGCGRQLPLVTLRFFTPNVQQARTAHHPGSAVRAGRSTS